ncbi:MAG: peptide ABC transporter substrate-binding protein, partial [Sulfurovum sp.]
MPQTGWIVFLWLCAMLMLDASVWNSPYPESQRQQNILFSSFSSSPKHLDPVVSYNANEWAILAQIYEPPLQYNYLKRPYLLEPLTLTDMPELVCLDQNGRRVNKESDKVAYSRYRLHLRRDIRYAPHPAFAKRRDGALLYGKLDQERLSSLNTIADLEQRDSRRVVAEDYAYAIKRMAVRQYHSPILDTMMPYIVGLEAFSKEITAIAQARQEKGEILDLRPYHIKGVKVIDEDTLD